jgi:hypothetical protein
MAKHVEVTREELNAVASEIIDLLLRKNHDYGDAWQATGLAGIFVRLKDKSLRLQNLSDGREALVVDERAEDTLDDIIGYCMLGKLYAKSQRS